MLGQLGVDADSFETHTAAVEPPAVWARMTRNLMIWHHRKGDAEGSHHWRCVGYGIEGGEIALDLDWSKSAGRTG